MDYSLSLQAIIPDDAQSLAEFLSAHEWPFHGGSRTTPAKVLVAFADGYYLSENIQSFWLLSKAEEKLGFIRLFDLEDDTPVFDLRLATEFRGQGYGTLALSQLCDYVFKTLTDKRRLEGHTREDNFAMQRVFEKCYFLKEAQHRRTWPDDRGNYYDSFGYGILREDWLTQSITPFAQAPGF